MIEQLRELLRRLTTGDYLILLALTTVVLALAWPSISARRFTRAVEQTVSDVESLRAGAEGALARTGRWPAPEAPGVIPTELASMFPDDSLLVRDRYTLQWQRWEMVDSALAPTTDGPAPVDAPPDSVGPRMVPVVRELGGVVVHTADAQVLAELLERYGDGPSFVRDTTWTLLVRHPRSGS